MNDIGFFKKMLKKKCLLSRSFSLPAGGREVMAEVP
jgi:hypothetical protein